MNIVSWVKFLKILLANFCLFSDGIPETVITLRSGAAEENSFLLISSRKDLCAQGCKGWLDKQPKNILGLVPEPHAKVNKPGEVLDYNFF